MDKFLDENGKEIDLKDLVRETSIELLIEKRRQATSLIKSFLIKVEALTEKVKVQKRELEKTQQSLTQALYKVERLKEGDWLMLSENKSQNKADTENKG